MQSLPIVKLREFVEKCTGVPTHQQRLTIGSTILEDWDPEDKMMFIGDYPAIHSGSLLYLIQLDRGFRIKVIPRRGISTLTCCGTRKSVVYQYEASYFYITVSVTEVIIHVQHVSDIVVTTMLLCSRWRSKTV